MPICLSNYFYHNDIRGSNVGLMYYTPSVTGVHRMVLNRGLDEGVRVKNRMDGVNSICLNTKNEYYKAEYIRLNVGRLV